MVLTQTSRLRLKQSTISSLIPHIYVVGCFFLFFLVIFGNIWTEMESLKGLVEFMKIGDFEDLVLF